MPYVNYQQAKAHHHQHLYFAALKYGRAKRFGKIGFGHRKKGRALQAFDLQFLKNSKTILSFPFT